MRQIVLLPIHYNEKKELVERKEKRKEEREEKRKEERKDRQRVLDNH